MVNLSGTPVMLLKDETEHIKGKKALTINIEVIRAVSETIRTTFGPKGLNKMIVDSLGDITVTNDGAKILDEIGVENSAAKMIVELSKTIHKNVGDGVSSSVIFIGELLAKTLDLITLGISPTQIYEGYLRAMKEVNKHLKSVAFSADSVDLQILSKLAHTVLNSKVSTEDNDKMVLLITRSLLSICENHDNHSTIDLDNIQIVKKEGKSLSESSLIEGVIIDKEVVNPMMPKYIENAQIALLDGSLEIIKTDFSAEIQITNPNEISSFVEKEKTMIEDLIKSLAETGVNVVFCQKGIDELAQNFLNKSHIMAIRRVKHSDMKKLSRATGARIITQVKGISQNDLGFAQIVSEKRIGKENMIFVEKCKLPKAVTILIRGGTEIITDDAERALKNGLAAVKSYIENPFYVSGAGSIEIELRRHLLQYAQKIGGKEQIAIEQYADAIEILPKILVENSGEDPLDIITTLRSKTNMAKKQYFGYDALSGKIVDPVQTGIIEPLQVKLKVFSLATELAVTFIRIDDYIRASRPH